MPVACANCIVLSTFQNADVQDTKERFRHFFCMGVKRASLLRRKSVLKHSTQEITHT
jgi:hypothetical protein